MLTSAISITSRGLKSVRIQQPMLLHENQIIDFASVIISAKKRMKFTCQQ